jgi:hypothetical protein
VEYPLAANSTHDKHFIGPNSHLMTHTDFYVDEFGVMRNTWVFAFESRLGEAKRYNSDHKNYQSEGKGNIPL